MFARRTFVYLVIFLLIMGWILLEPQIDQYITNSTRQLDTLRKGSIGEAVADIEVNISTPPPLKSEKESPNPVLTHSGTIEWTNRNRNENGLPNLTENQDLNEAAMAKAEDMLENQYFDHVSPSGNGPQDLAEKAGYEYISIGENLAMGNFANDKELLEAWMASPGHRENILNKGFHEIGVAVLEGKYQGKKTWFAVQEFGTPLSDCPRASSKKKKIIESNIEKIENLSEELESERDEAESLRPRDPDYSEAIDDYNAKVRKYNTLVKETQDLIKEYNLEAAAFNKCIKKFTD